MKGKFKFKEGYTHRMPVQFIGYPFMQENCPVSSDCLELSVDQLTDMAALAEYVPAEFEVLEPVLHWSYCNCRGVSFLSNGEYRILQAFASVRYNCHGREINGVYPLVLWEDNPIPIIGGREEDGMPKIYCDISAERHYENHWFINVSLNCATMVHLDFFEEGEVPENERKTVLMNSFGYRYIPLVDKGGAALMEPILYPQEYTPVGQWHGTGEVQVIPVLHWYENPTMFSILDGLAGLPNHGFCNARRQRASVRLCVSDSRALNRL